jgi:hypothetical protein
VPPLGVIESIAAAISNRSVVGDWRTRACWLNATTPTLIRPGTLLTKRRAARLAATSRLGSTSVAVIEPDTSVASTIDARSTGTATVRCGLAAARTRRASARASAAIGAWRRQRGLRGATDGWRRGAAKAAAAAWRRRCSARYHAARTGRARRPSRTTGSAKLMGCGPGGPRGSPGSA